jgi:hypothetical protein
VDIERPTFLDNYQLINRREAPPWPSSGEKPALTKPLKGVRADAE